MFSCPRCSSSNLTRAMATTSALAPSLPAARVAATPRPTMIARQVIGFA